MARHLLVKKNFRLFVLAHGPKIGLAAGTLKPTRRRHRRRGAERQAPRPRQDRTQYPPRTRDVSASAPHCCSAAPLRIWTDNPRRRAWPARPVQHHETAAGGGWPRRSLVLGSAATLPAAPDNHQLCAIVGPSGQLLCQDTGVDEGTGQDGPSATGGIYDPRSVRSGEGYLGAWRYLRTHDLRWRVAEIEADHFRAPSLPDAEIRPGGCGLFDGSDGHYPCALRDEDCYGCARPEGVDHDHHRTGAGRSPRPALPARVAGDHGVRSRVVSNTARL